jgi:hypothetical protein
MFDRRVELAEQLDTGVSPFDRWAAIRWKVAVYEVQIYQTPDCPQHLYLVTVQFLYQIPNGIFLLIIQVTGKKNGKLKKGKFKAEIFKKFNRDEPHGGQSIIVRVCGHSKFLGDAWEDDLQKAVM